MTHPHSRTGLYDEIDRLQAGLAMMIKRFHEVVADRDERKRQHENLLEVHRRDLAALAAKLKEAPEHVEEVYLAVRIAAEGSDWKRDSGESLAAWIDRTISARPEARRSGCACELDEQGDLVVRWCALHAVLKDALEAFVKAEGDWLAQKSGMPPGFFDDPLSDAYKQAKAALADVSAVSPLRQKP